MKLSIFGSLTAILLFVTQSPAHARSWRMLAECHFVSADGKEQIDDTCEVEGSSGQGMTYFTIKWRDGVQTRVSGNFATRSNYKVDQKPAIQRSVNNVTFLRTDSGNVIILHKLRDLEY